MEILLTVVGGIVCAVLAIRAARLLTAALWLAGVSMLTALTLYLMGAHQVAVIELSVGAGLVTVLFVFAITIAGEDAMQLLAPVPRPLAWLLTGFAMLVIAYLVLPSGDNGAAAAESNFAGVFWQDRALDVLAQIALIFTGVLGVLGLLSESTTHSVVSAALEAPDPEETPTPPASWSPTEVSDPHEKELV